MSADWGGLMPDPAFRDLEAGPSPIARSDRSDDAGAWPEEIDVRFVADGSMSVPGKGKPGKNCGEWYPTEFCDECGEPHFGASRCEQRTCPDCWASWSRRRAEKITRRLGSARYAAEMALEKRALHTVVSPPAGEIRTLTDVQRGFRDAYELAKEKGVRGGVAIFHGYRVTEKGKRMYAEAIEADDWDPEGDGKLWSFVRGRERRLSRTLVAKDWRGLTYWSPHWHILGLAEDFEADDPGEQDGWVARRIRSLEPFKLRDDAGYEDMVGTARYLLSHATFETGSSKDCVRWFGEFATAKFSPEAELSDGALSVIERKAAEAAGSFRRGDGSGTDEPEPCENCGSESRSSIWEAGAALADPEWCDQIGRE